MQRPELIDQQITADAALFTLRIPKNLIYFDGHFEQIAVVPGVVQIHWAIDFARRQLDLKGVFSHMEAIKFKELLLPGQQLQLELRHFGPSNKLEFRYHATEDEYSSGRIYFHEPV